MTCSYGPSILSAPAHVKPMDRVARVIANAAGWILRPARTTAVMTVLTTPPP
jgi:hypothetical protein